MSNKTETTNEINNVTEIRISDRQRIGAELSGRNAYKSRLDSVSDYDLMQDKVFKAQREAVSGIDAAITSLISLRNQLSDGMADGEDCAQVTLWSQDVKLTRTKLKDVDALLGVWVNRVKVSIEEVKEQREAIARRSEAEKKAEEAAIQTEIAEYKAAKSRERALNSANGTGKVFNGLMLPETAQ